MEVQGAERAQILARLEELEAEERLVSAERRRLHDRLNAFFNEAAAQREAQLSQRRKELHVEIDALRVKVGRTPGPIRAEKEDGHVGTFWSQDEG